MRQEIVYQRQVDPRRAIPDLPRVGESSFFQPVHPGIALGHDDHERLMNRHARARFRDVGGAHVHRRKTFLARRGSRFAHGDEHG